MSKTIPHTYRDMAPDKYEAILSNFLISYWSYSAISAYQGNQKRFEKEHIYRERGASPATTIAGSAYHYALEQYFKSKQKVLEGKYEKELDVLECSDIAFNFIDEYPAHKWKTQKTLPTIEECKIAATKSVTALIENFFKEIDIYGDIKRVLFVEELMTQFVTINGVDIPLPCVGSPDLVVETMDGKIVIMDHKSLKEFTADEDVQYKYGVQSINYFKLVSGEIGKNVDEVWFIENKYSKNRDLSSQLKCHKVIMDEDTVKVYEAMLYEPLRQVLMATSDPDFVYVMNPMDIFMTISEMEEFWAKTMIAEVEDFNIPDDKKPIIEKRLKKIRDATTANISPRVIKNYRANASKFIKYDYTNKDMTNAEKIEHIYKTLGIPVRVAHEFDGFSSDSYLLDVAAGVEIKKVYKHSMDVAKALGVSSVRMPSDLVVVDGSSYVAVEANKDGRRTLEYNADDLVDSRIPLGKDNYNNVIYWDVDNPSTPHLLKCGSTGSGKSMSIKSTIKYGLQGLFESFVILDSKFSDEFLDHKSDSRFEIHNEIYDIENKLKDLVEEMNNRVKNGIVKKTLIIFDEFSDAIENGRKGRALDVRADVLDGVSKSGAPKIKNVVVGREKSIEENLKLLLQKGRSCGFRILAATQRASVKVITGDAKANFPVLVCFKVPKSVDSKVVLDEEGAEKLLGKGDGLMISPDFPSTTRFQGYYVQ
jgi:hypothetical protein